MSPQRFKTPDLKFKTRAVPPIPSLDIEITRYVFDLAELIHRSFARYFSAWRLDHGGMVANFPTGALAHLGLARAYALSGDTAKAKTAYQDFFTLWKDADPDIPILKEAKVEYAKLQ